MTWCFNTLGPTQNGGHFADGIFRCIFVNENVWIPIKISLKFVLNGSINNIPALVQIMACSRAGDKPLSKPMMVSLPTHICVSRSQWVNTRTSLAVILANIGLHWHGFPDVNELKRPTQISICRRINWGTSPSHLPQVALGITDLYWTLFGTQTLALDPTRGRFH